jgi:hypothetical protein
VKEPTRCPVGHPLTRLTEWIYACADNREGHGWLWRWTGEFLAGVNERSTHELAAALILERTAQGRPA